MLLACASIAALVAVAVVPTLAAATPPSYTGVSSRTQSLTQVTDTSLEHAEHPALNLVSAMVPWRVLEPTDQVFDWARMDANVEDARAGGYRLIVRIMAGRLAPAWLADVGAQEVSLLATDPNAPDYCDRVTIPVPWDPVLAAQYRELMHEVARWLDQADGAGGRTGDHVFLVPVSMPSSLGTEMVIGYGASTTCPSGTDGAGTSLRSTNLAAWNALSTEDVRRSLTEQAWRDAVSIQMAELPVQNDSLIAYGAVFGDGQAAAVRISADEVARYPDRLWSMYTNLQPAIHADGTFGPWREFCPACHQAIVNAIAAGGVVGFQTAGGSSLDTAATFQAAVEDALASYPIAFLETGPDRVDRYEGYLLTDPDPVQARIARVVDDRITSTSVACDPATIGAASGCTATLTELAGDPPGEPGGADAVAWSSNGPGAFSPATCTPSGGNGVSTCSVAYTPAPGAAGSQTITATYAGDATHVASRGWTTIAVAPDAPPAVAITFPADGAVVAKGKTIVVTASASDDVGVMTVVFSINGTARCTDAAAPYSCSWAVPKKANAKYTLGAVATDTGSQTASTTIGVTAR